MFKLLRREVLMRVFVKNLDIGIWGSGGGPPLLSLLMCELVPIPCICVQERVEVRGRPWVSSFRLQIPFSISVSHGPRAKLAVQGA